MYRYLGKLKSKLTGEKMSNSVIVGLYSSCLLSFKRKLLELTIRYCAFQVLLKEDKYHVKRSYHKKIPPKQNKTTTTKRIQENFWK